MFSRFLRPPTDKAIPQLYALSILFVVIGNILGAITNEKTMFLYKETLHLTPSDIATLNLILAIPVYVQPFLAAFTEFVPWFGYRRRSYFAAGIVVGALGYALIGVLPRYTYQTLVPLLLIVVTGATVRGIVFNAVYAAVGNRTGILPRLQSTLTIIGLTLTLTYTSHLGGYVAAYWSYKAAFLVATALTLAKIPLLWLIPDTRITPVGVLGSDMDTGKLALAQAKHAEEQRAARIETMRALRATSGDTRFWAAIAMIAFIALTPFPASALIYYQTDFLHFSKQFIGDLNAWSSAGAFAGLAIFFALGKKLRLRALPYIYIGFNALVYVCYLFMHDAVSAKACFVISGGLGVFLSVAGAILAARICPRGAEGTVFAFYGTVTTFFGLLCDKWGTYLYDHYGPANMSAHYTVVYGWNVSLYVGLGMTIIAFVFIPFLPKWAHSDVPLSAPAEGYKNDVIAPVTSATAELP